MPTSTHPSSALTPLYPLLFVALWSTGFIGAKFGLPDAEPLTFLSLRYALVLVLMDQVNACATPIPDAMRERIARFGPAE